MTAPDSRRRTYAALLASACALLLVLPFVTTFNDFLTAGVIRLGIAGPFQVVAQLEARTAVGLIRLLGLHAGAAGNQVVIQSASDHTVNLFLSWNCVGWQSLILFGLSLLTGLRGNQRLDARLQLLLIGLLGTVLVNLLRITLVCLLAATAGYVPAVLFHDYGGSLMTIAWLFAFWALAYRWILPQPDGVAA